MDHINYVPRANLVDTSKRPVAFNKEDALPLTVRERPAVPWDQR